MLRNLAIAFINGLLTLIILLIAPLVLLAVIVNTFFVTVASFIVGIAGDGVIRWLLRKPDLYFLFSPANQGRSRRPPGNPVNALLSFGYQVLWNHLLVLIELQGLDPYQACLHEGSERHAALASDLIEEFRVPIIDSLVLYLVNRNMLNIQDDFEYRDGGCFLGSSGRKVFLRAFVQRMEEEILTEQRDRQPRWHLLMSQVKSYKRFIYSPVHGYQPSLIR